MSTRLRSTVSSFLLAIIGAALSGTITAFVVLTVYFAALQMAPARASSEVEGLVHFQQLLGAANAFLRG